MAGPYFNEYLGSWVGGDPPQTNSVEDMYRGILPPSGGDLATRKVNTTPIDPRTGMPYAPAEGLSIASMFAVPGAGARADAQAAASAIPHADGTIVANKDQSRLAPNAFGYGTNGVTGGSPAVAAIETAAPGNPFAGSAYKGTFRPTAYMPSVGSPAGAGLTGDPDDYGTGLFGAPMSRGMAETLAGGQQPLSAPAVLPTPAAPPKGLLQTIAEMFAPAGNGGTVTQGANGPLNSLTQQSDWWKQATGQSSGSSGGSGFSSLSGG